MSRKTSCKQIYIVKVATVIDSHETFILFYYFNFLKIDPDPIKLYLLVLGSSLVLVLNEVFNLKLVVICL